MKDNVVIELIVENVSEVASVVPVAVVSVVQGDGGVEVSRSQLKGTWHVAGILFPIESNAPANTMSGNGELP